MKRLTISHESPSCDLLSGPGARDLILKVTKRSPVWATLSRGWVVQPHHVDKIVAIALDRGYEIVDIEPGVDHSNPVELT